MVEPRRRCFSLPAVDLKKHAVGGILNVSVISGNNLVKRVGDSPLEKRTTTNGHHTTTTYTEKVNRTFVEMTVEDLTRKTRLCPMGGSCQGWKNESSDMVLHDNDGTLHLNVYEQGTNNMKFDFIGSCEIKVR
jgi:hypothetical protein